jgi:hypothetical protein
MLKPERVNEAGGPVNIPGIGLDRFAGSGSKPYNSSSSGGIQHSISNELISIPQSTIDNFGVQNPYYHHGGPPGS